MDTVVSRLGNVTFVSGKLRGWVKGKVNERIQTGSNFLCGSCFLRSLYTGRGRVPPPPGYLLVPPTRTPPFQWWYWYYYYKVKLSPLRQIMDSQIASNQNSKLFIHLLYSPQSPAIHQAIQTSQQQVYT